MLLERLQAVFVGEADALVASREAVPALRVVEREELADAAAAEHEEVGEPPQVDIHGALAPHAAPRVDVAAERQSAHEVAHGAESAGHVTDAEVHRVAELAPDVAADQLGLVSRGEVLAQTESVDHVGRVEAFAVETHAGQQGVLVVQNGVVVGAYRGPFAHAAVVVAPRDVEARPERGYEVRVAAPGVEVALLDQQRRVLLDHVAFFADVAVGQADLVVGRSQELLAEPEAERRVVEVAPAGEVGRVEGSQHVGNLVFDQVAAVGEVLAVEVGVDAQQVARAEDVGVVDPDGRAPFGVEPAVDADGPAVARGDGDVHAGRVHGVGDHADVDIGEVGARAEQLFVADDRLGVELLAGAEEQVAADDPFARQHVRLVGRAFEPVAVGVEDRAAVDRDFADRLAGKGFEQHALVDGLPRCRRVEHGTHEEHAVEHAGHAAARGFRLDAVVEALAVRVADGIEASGAVGGEVFGLVHLRTYGKRDGRGKRRQQQDQYANSGEHTSKITHFHDKKYQMTQPRSLRIQKKVRMKRTFFRIVVQGG